MADNIINASELSARDLISLLEESIEELLSKPSLSQKEQIRLDMLRSQLTSVRSSRSSVAALEAQFKALLDELFNAVFEHSGGLN